MIISSVGEQSSFVYSEEVELLFAAQSILQGEPVTSFARKFMEKAQF